MSTSNDIGEPGTINVVVLHGIGSSPGAHWQQWLHDQLVARGHSVAMPALPDPDDPDRDAWRTAASGAIESGRSERTVIVGHSLGVTTALDCLETATRPFLGLVSVSGFSRDYGLDLNGRFLRSRDVDFAKVRANVRHARVLFGDDDPWVARHALEALATDLAVEPVIVAGGGHLNTAAGYLTFPAVLDACEAIALR